MKKNIFLIMVIFIAIFMISCNKNTIQPVNDQANNSEENVSVSKESGKEESNEETQSEDSNEEAQTEESSEEAQPEESSGEAQPEESSEEAQSEESSEEAQPEESSEEAQPEESSEEAQPEENTQEAQSEDNTQSETVVESQLEFIANKEFEVNEVNDLVINIAELATGIGSAAEVTEVFGPAGYSISADKKSIIYHAGEVPSDMLYDFNATISENGSAVSGAFRILVKNMVNLEAIENISFEANEMQNIQILITDIVSGVGNEGEIVRVTGISGAGISADKRRIIYTAEEVTADTTYNVSVDIEEAGVYVTVNFPIRINNIEELKAKQNVVLRMKEGENLVIRISDLVTGARNQAQIIDAFVPKGTVEITQDKKNINYGIGYLKVGETLDSYATITENGQSVGVAFKIQVEDYTMKAIENQAFKVQEGSDLEIGLISLFKDPTDSCQIRGLGTSPGIANQFIIYPNKQGMTFKTKDVSKNTQYDVSVKVFKEGKFYDTSFQVIVQEVGNKRPKKLYQGDHYIAEIPSNKGTTMILLGNDGDFIGDEDLDDALHVIKVVKEGENSPADFYCKEESFTINGKKLEMIKVGVNQTLAPGSEPSVQIFRVIVSDGTDGTVLKIKVQKDW